MMRARRHPFAATLFVILGALFVLTALVADPEERSDVIAGLVLIYLLLLGLYLLVSWIYRNTIGRRRAPAPLGPISDTIAPTLLRTDPRIAQWEPKDLSLRTEGPNTASAAAPVAPSPAPLAPSLGNILALTPAQFEEATLDLLVAIGYQDARRVGGSGDLNADIVCRDPQGRSTVIQCKRYAPGSTVGTPDIQTFIGMKNVHHRAERGIFVTTTTYSQPATALAQQHGIALIDGAALLLLAQLTGRLLDAQSSHQTTSCPHCGNDNPSTAQFCDRCGAPLTTMGGLEAARHPLPEPSSVTTSGAATYVECPRCHSRQAVSVRFCTNCGLARTAKLG